MISEYTLFEFECARLEVQRLHHCVPQTVHYRQSLGKQNQHHSTDKHQSQQHVVLVRQQIGQKGLEGILHIVGHEYLEGNDETPTDQNDDLHLVDALDYEVEVWFHHNAGHLEVEVEKGHEEQQHD